MIAFYESPHMNYGGSTILELSLNRKFLQEISIFLIFFSTCMDSHVYEFFKNWVLKLGKR